MTSRTSTRFRKAISSRRYSPACLRLGHTGIRRIERDLCHPARKMVAFLGAEFGKAVVDQTNELVDLRRSLGEGFHRWLRVRQDLLVVLETVDHLLAVVEVEQRRQGAHPLAHVLVVAGDLL